MDSYYLQGDVKLFDFGLATEITSAKANEDGTYNLTADTGSLRYMAPEVGIGKPYNLTADTYSFGVLLWQIKAMKTPFMKITPSVFKSYVVNGSLRPKIEKDWSKTMSELMESCWSSKISDRPTFESIIETLRNESFGISNQDQTSAMDISTRSYSDFLGDKL